ncbi:SDR family NAD(P)-dependent oxidoreductase [Microbulbifer sp. ZKSA006]|uniref:SDR family NAD(P)-dependent oxidoreductase n=1 Tax=Microbulbifer sp. ZKSA006 TaxID=3243390 RepID=UPI0040392370
MKKDTLERYIVRDLKISVSDLLGVPKDELGLDVNLGDLGLGSIGLSAFAITLGELYSIEFNPSIFFSYPTLEKVGEYLIQDHLETVERFYGQDFASTQKGTTTEKNNTFVQSPSGGEACEAESKGSGENRINDPIAIIGMSGRLPQARNIQEMWEILEAGKEVVTEIPADRFDWRKYYSSITQEEGKTNSRWCGCIPGVDEFDSLFFSISPHEAANMDPKQRLLLQEAWNALEDAGYGSEHIKTNKMGMYVGVEQGDYQLLSSRAQPGLTYNHDGILASRLAYFLDFDGPVMAVNTSCSSSLVAVHLACQSLRNGESDTAIAAGVNLMLTHKPFVAMSEAGMLSADGKCYAFGEQANGMVPGEAVVAVVLKPLSNAKRDGDPIYAVIDGNGINYDGKTNGITAPSGASQTALLESVYQNFNISVEDIQYVVAHGTGTRLGDPIEVNALNDAFKNNTSRKEYCALTSPKTNFGHTLAASGIVGLVSLVKALEHETIPASLHCPKENNYINWKDSPFYVNKENIAWQQNDRPRIGAVSSFGMSGTNAHVVLKSYSLDTQYSEPDLFPYSMLILSAKTLTALQQKVDDLMSYLLSHPCTGAELSQVAYTLMAGRQHFKYRCAVVVQTSEDACQALQIICEKSTQSNVFQGEVKRGFSGQRAVYQCIEDLIRQSHEVKHQPDDYRENLIALSEFYCQGYAIDWKQLYSNRLPQRVHLPAYPFDKERHWISDDIYQESVTAVRDESFRKEEPISTGNSSDMGVLLFKPNWVQKNCGAVIAERSQQRYLVLCDADRSWEQQLSEQLDGVVVVNLVSESTNVDTQPEQYFELMALQLFEQVQGILKSKPGGIILVQVLMSKVPAWLCGMSGLLKTANLENPQFFGQLIEYENNKNVAQLAEIVNLEAQQPQDSHIRYHREVRYVADWAEIEESGRGSEENAICWKDKGVYLITGGNGGLGLIFANEIARRVTHASIVLVGRSELTDVQQERLSAIEKSGARVVYHATDIASKQAVVDLIQGIQSEFGRLNGIIHSAGAIHDNFILRKTKDEMSKVLSPKVKGTIYLDQATKEMDLDFYILFSSISGCLGNVGQADYAVANTFMDAYAHYRNDLVKNKQRRGKTLSINWPQWKEGGMRIDADTEKWLFENRGMTSLENHQGIGALYWGTEIDAGQVMVMAGDLERLRTSLSTPLSVESASPEPAERNTKVDSEKLKEKTLHQIKVLFGEVTHMALPNIEVDEALESYGIDSIMITRLNQKLQKVFGGISKTLFYEYQTLGELTEYFVRDYFEVCCQWVGLGQAGSAADISGVDASISVATGEQQRSTKTAAMSHSTHVSEQRTADCPSDKNNRDAQQCSGREPIAIIGMSGRYPDANNLDEFWENIKFGKNSITEIPEERWSLEGFFNDDVQEALEQGKSYGKWGGFLEGFANFDPLFFNISPREAFTMDPQERVFIESCWSVFEDAGYTREKLAERHGGRVGVFAGITKTGFDLHGPGLWQQGQNTVIPETSFSSVANRVSYFFNLNGPSMPVDTMCSASLTAIHEACEHIYRNECELAIAGGVNIYLHPSNYVILSKQRMLSVNGLCKSFGEGGNGFVPGEGVGTVLLKPLSKAQADGDRIYAVIRGTSINHGGKTNGYTVPNPTMQAALVRQALDNSRVNARSVSYIEAHGTGTELGDPIELTGLKQAFSKDTSDTQFCALGSVKSNIGHLEAAAGIAGLTKIVLQMQHQQLAPSLHTETLNPNIDFANSPFVVQRHLAEWPRLSMEAEDERRSVPRIAGVSSFGAGGSNAHVIVEEYIADEHKASNSVCRPNTPQIIVLSAKNEDRLKHVANNLKIYLTNENNLSQDDLPSLAYTLQTGREEMPERLAMVVNSLDELKTKLAGYLDGNDSIEDLYFGRVNKNNKTLKSFSSDDEFKETVAKWIKRRKYSKLLSLWVDGLKVDWRGFYSDTQLPPLVQLPTYPFEKERFWIEVDKRSDRGIGGAAVVENLHPLVHKNQSTAFEFKFASHFTGREFFLEDHQVKGTKILPGVCHIEMARKAASLILCSDGNFVVSDVVWLRPVLVVDSHIEVHTSIYPVSETEVEYEITSVDGENNPVICSQGVVSLVDADGQPSVDLEALQKLCDRQPRQAEQLYEAYQTLGFNYGPTHKGINSLAVGLDSQHNANVLACLQIPSAVADSSEQFYLHPSLLDSALQSTVGMQYAEDRDPFSSSEILLPFALGSLSIYRSCPEKIWCWIRYSTNSHAEDAVKKFDISLCDEQGNVCVEFGEFSFRAMSEGSDLHSKGRAIIMKPIWEVKDAGRDTDPQVEEQFEEHHLLLLGGSEIANLGRDLESVIPGIQCEIVSLERSNVVNQYEQATIAVFSKIKGILSESLRHPVLLQVLIDGKLVADGSCLTGISGMLRTASQENPNLVSQCIQLETSLSGSELASFLKHDASDRSAKEIRYRDQLREVRQLIEADVVNSQRFNERIWKDNGVYLITGGLGGLGLIFANDIALNTQNATVILTGRKTLTDSSQAKLDNLTAQGLRVDYRQVDVADLQAVEALVNHINDVYGKLNAILHSAGVIRDNYIINKTEEEMREVFAPKVRGLVNLDMMTKALPLENFLFFSSTSSALGNPGQADYAAANGFMDAYAGYRNRLVDSGQRRGKTLSINWPLWTDGGMQVDDTVQERLRRLGLHPLKTDIGVTAFKQSLQIDGAEQVLVWTGDSARVSELFSPKEDERPDRKKQTIAADAPPVNEDSLKDHALRYFKQILSSSLQLSADRIDADAPLEQYGIDSILVMELSNVLENIFGPLSKTLLFEVQTVQALAEYFLESHAEKMLELLGKTGKPATASPKSSDQQVIPSHIPLTTKGEAARLNENAIRQKRQYRRNFTSKFAAAQDNAIAVIGLSGRYPQSKNVNEFWQNLVDGKDCVTEVPENRWDHSQYFDPDKDKPGKCYSKWGGFIDGVDEFDTLFFNISPKEAEMMDPQERLFLQCVYETIEDAGYTRQALAKLGSNDPDCIAGNVGVFVGVMYEEYQLFGAQAQAKGKAVAISGNPASIANRVSYFCDFHGPSMAVDTMCSSSLATIHLACQNLINQQCEVAIAGGVNVSIHPNKYLSLSQGKFASSTGKCESFGEGGDGYVPSEGVGAVLLKPLAKAIEDNDNIYGVIKGTAINHGGKTNGYTVPNPKAQSDVVIKALKQANIDPRTISYVEAHGTGTSLGDPIEITGLTDAYRKFSDDDKSSQGNVSYCSIGSAKSNIGHCEGAAGIAGVTKILMQMKHETLVPSLHSSTLNPRIDFAKTPFVVQQKLEPWTRPTVTINTKQKEYHRTAGICSFGAGGSNAHVIIEEYIPESVQQQRSDFYTRPVIIVLSAKSKQQLKTQAENLYAATKERFEESDLESIAYTLQTGREAFEYRLAFEADNLAMLVTRLEEFLTDQFSSSIYQEKVGSDKGALSLFFADEDLRQAISTWIAKGKYDKLLELWVKGLSFDWQELYQDMRQPKRISLPTYPFAKERYWIDELLVEDNRSQNGFHQLHPLLHQNTSDFFEQRFTSHFSGEEQIFKDHRVNGEKVLPGVAVLEMAREAVERAAGGGEQYDGARLQLKNIAWTQPLTVDSESVQVDMRLCPEENGDIRFELTDQGETLFSQGCAQFVEQVEPASLNLQTLLEECRDGDVSGDDCYSAYLSMGLDYGPSHRGVEHIYVGDNQVLAKLSLPVDVNKDQVNMVLHPGLMDSALQVAIGLLPIENLPIQAALPFALNELNVFSPCPSSVWVWLRSYVDTAVPDNLQKVDIDLCDDNGHVCVQMHGLLTRTLTSQDHKPVETLLLTPQWEMSFIELMPKPEYQKKIVVLCDADKRLQRQLSEQLVDVEVINLLPEGAASNSQVEVCFEQLALQLFDRVKDLLGSKPKSEIMVQLLVDRSKQSLCFSGLLGLFKTACLENPKFVGQVIEVDNLDSAVGLAALLEREDQCPQDPYIRYSDGERYIADWRELTAAEDSVRSGTLPWKDSGVYLITGGAGGLGLIFANEIARHTSAAVIILTGRSTLNESRQAELHKLEEQGAKAVYRNVDVTNEQEVFGLIRQIEMEFGALNGIIHSAGVIDDSFILKKTKAQVSRVLAPKVNGTVYLDQATKELDLDFFVLFSSISGCLGNTGQADYSIANTFMDVYAHYRNGLMADNLRRGQTLSIDWPLWREGGMQIDEETEKWLRKNSGMVPLETREGVRAFYRGLETGAGQIAVLHGDKNALYSKHVKRDVEKSLKAKVDAAIDNSEKSKDLDVDDILKEKVVSYLKQELATVTKLGADRIDAEASLDHYGIDSVMVMQLTGEMEKKFGSLPKTLFFEYQNIDELSGYFMENFHEELKTQFELNKPSPAARTIGSVALETSYKDDVRGKNIRAEKKLRPRFYQAEAVAEKRSDDIAIIGVSGRYPKANNINEYWENLLAGKDCIVEVPENRWDHSRYFSEDRSEPGKTYSKWGGFIDGVDEFDPLFFNISPREAEVIDPQERLFLQTVYETLEDAGYSTQSLSRRKHNDISGNVGVYVGVMYEEYQLYGAQALGHKDAVAIGGTASSIANRVSYYCGFSGPSMAVDTMCSSSLTAIHLACRSLQQGDCEMAVAGGVNVSIHPNKYILLAQGNFVSSRGRCESFGIGGDGYVPGEGVGAILLKPLSRAIEDGDHIYGTIKGTAINHGGRTNGYTVPNPNAQASVIGQAYKHAGINPRTVSYMEAHGTGTSLGDPIEISGLSKAFKEYSKDKQYCAIGSAKSNIGHCESAAGIAGVTKVLLQLKHQKLVPTLHVRETNPNIDFMESPFVVQNALESWHRPTVSVEGKSKEYPRIAGVSSFGAGGSNAHVIIEEFTPEQDGHQQHRFEQGHQFAFVLSARTEEQLMRVAENLKNELEKKKEISAKDLESIAYTLQVGRAELNERLAVLAKSGGELLDKLEGFTNGTGADADVYRGTVQQNKHMTEVLTKDKDFKAMLDSWTQQGKFSKVLDLWTKGIEVDWGRFYSAGHLPHRVSLPTYPFARDRYWIDFVQSNSTSLLANAGEMPAPAENKVAETRFLEKVWTHTPEKSNQVRDDDNVLILHSVQTKPLAELVAGHFDRVTLLCEQDIPDRGGALNALIGQCNGWVDLIGCGSDDTQSLNWINVLQQLIENSRQRELRLLCVTGGLESFRNSQINLSGASRAALYRMLQSEYTSLQSKHIDLAANDLLSEDSAKLIVDEYNTRCSAVEVCYRKGLRYVSSLAQLDPASPSRYSPPVRMGKIDENQVLLVVGGTRGLGLLCARHYIEKHGVRRVVLTGKQPLPPRSQWHQNNHHSPDVLEKIHAIEDLEKLGARVEVLCLSLADAEAVSQQLTRVQKELGQIGGIIYSAGCVDTENPAFIRKSTQSIARVLEPKVEGINHILQYFQTTDLEFVLLFSSVSAVVPTLGSGQSDYAMANAYLDYVASDTSKKFPVVSIQWPSWKDTGMGEVNSVAYRDTGFLSLTDKKGLQLLDQIVRLGLGRVVMPVLIKDPGSFRAQQLMFAQLHPNKNIPKNVNRTAVTSATSQRIEEGNLQHFNQWLHELFAGELKMELDQLDQQTSFQDYGVDSIILAQISRKISNKIQLEFDPSALFEHSTLGDLSAWFNRTYQEELERAFTTSEKDEFNTVEFRELTPQEDDQSSRTEETDRAEEDIAVVGMSCNFPGAGNLEEYWQLLIQGRSSISVVPENRLGEAKGLYAGLLDRNQEIDAKFFNLSESDVKAMDPQACLLLEESLKTIYHAGYSPKELQGGSVGVYIGARSQHRPSETKLAAATNPVVAVGQNYLSANISQYYNFQGPSLVLDTACSSTMVATDIAIQALKSKAVNAALVGGVSLLTSDSTHRLFSQRNLLNNDGEFHIFDKRASGIVLSEGVGMAMLKTRQQAERDGDTIYALIKGISTNNDGRTAGPATPNVEAQKNVMKSALAKSGFSADDVEYIEVNGSGSTITDLLELKAIDSVYGRNVSKPCYLGSMKPNIGHPLCAEGIAGFIKTVLMLHKRSTVPFLSGQVPMDHFGIEASRFEFCRKPQPWDSGLAVLNSFGDGGTNAHVVIQSYVNSAQRVKHTPKKPPEAICSEQPVRENAHGEHTDGRALTHTFEQSRVWESLLSPDNQILQGHYLQGNSLLPGLAYIDLLYQWFTERGEDYRQFELRNLAIFRPLIVAKGEGVYLDISAQKTATGFWKIFIKRGLSEQKNVAANEPFIYATAEMHPCENTSFAERVDVLGELAGCKSSVSMSSVYYRCRHKDLLHSGIMQAQGRVFGSDSDTWIELSVNDNARVCAHDYLFHPALIDGSAVGVDGFNEESRLFVPVFCKNFRASEPFTVDLLTRVRRQTVEEKGEVIRMNMEFFHSSGYKIGELTDFTSKRVRKENLHSTLKCIS